MSATSVGYLSQHQENANQFAKFSHMTQNEAKGVECNARNIFVFFDMDLTIADSLASIVAKVPLDTLLTVILEQLNFTKTPARVAIIDNADALAHLLFNHPETRDSAQRVAFGACTEILMGEITRMGRRDNRWHFSAQNASAQRIEAFSMADMSHKLKEQSPHLWQILSSMLVSDFTHESRRAQYLQKETPKEPSEMMVDTEGFEPPCAQATQASQTWDEEDYWACDANGNLESSKVEGDNDDDGRPTKRLRRAGTRNSNLVQVMSDEFSTGPSKVLTICPENCYDRFYILDELKSEMQRPTFNIRTILPFDQSSGTGHRNLGTCRALHLNELHL